MQTVEQVLAECFGIEVSEVTDEMEYQSIAAWSSLGHVRLMLRLEELFCIKVEADDVPELSSVARIRDFVNRHHGGEVQGQLSPLIPQKENGSSTRIHRGLNDVYFDRSSITFIDGASGTLLHRGYSIEDLTEHASFEEAAYLLLQGELPNNRQLNSFHRDLQSARSLPEGAIGMLRLLQDAHPVDALRTMISALSSVNLVEFANDQYDTYQIGVRLLSQIPMIVGAHHRLRSGLPPVSPDESLSHAEHCLQQLFGDAPSSWQARLMEQDLILHLDHGANAASFAARITASTGSDLYSSICAAIAVFAGPLHGGAIAEVVEMIRDINEPQLASEYVQQRLKAGSYVPGFGHRVYRTEDPRATLLRSLCKKSCERSQSMRIFSILEVVENAMRPYIEHGAAPNVNLYGTALYLSLDIPEDLFVSMFVMGRMVGWLVQVMEQQADNILIRPRLSYAGPAHRPYVPLSFRQE